jgi:hypothetical protein
MAAVRLAAVRLAAVRTAAVRTAAAGMAAEGVARKARLRVAAAQHDRSRQMAESESLAVQLEALERQLEETGAQVAGFGGELERMRGGIVLAERDMARLTTAFGGSLRRAFDGMVFDGMRVSDALRGVARGMAGAVYDTAMRPVQRAAGGALAEGLAGLTGLTGAVMPFAAGGVIAQGRSLPMGAGVVAGPSLFGMHGGMGLMGEAGPEAILPLARGADGRLGVQAPGGGARPVSVVMNVTTPDVQGFERSRAQIAAHLGRALARGQRNG